jgi:arylsulfatase
MAIMEPPPTGLPARNRFEYRPFGGMIPEAVCVDVKRRSHTITASVDIADGETPNGVLVAMGTVLGGYSFFVDDGCLQYVHNFVGRREDHIGSSTPIPPGAHELVYEYRCDDPWGGGHGTLKLDGEVVGEGDIRRFTPIRWSITGAGLTCGYDGVSPVTARYPAPNRFTGRLEKVVIEVADAPEVDPATTFRNAMAAD